MKTGVFPYHITTTLGVELAFKTMLVGDKLVKLNIWDPSGQEKFSSVAQNFARNAHGAMLIYSYCPDTSESLLRIPFWIDFLKKSTCYENIGLVLVGNKMDIPERNRTISSSQGSLFAREHGIPFFETSALDGINVEAVFRALVVETLDKIENKRLSYQTPKEKAAAGIIKVVKVDDEKKKNDGCCC